MGPSTGRAPLCCPDLRAGFRFGSPDPVVADRQPHRRVVCVQLHVHRPMRPRAWRRWSTPSRPAPQVRVVDGKQASDLLRDRANTSSGAAPPATSVATRRNAACSSASTRSSSPFNGSLQRPSSRAPARFPVRFDHRAIRGTPGPHREERRWTINRLGITSRWAPCDRGGRAGCVDRRFAILRRHPGCRVVPGTGNGQMLARAPPAGLPAGTVPA
jgi:hypothetical protein